MWFVAKIRTTDRSLEKVFGEAKRLMAWGGGNGQKGD